MSKIQLQSNDLVKAWKVHNTTSSNRRPGAYFLPSSWEPEIHVLRGGRNLIETNGEGIYFPPISSIQPNTTPGLIMWDRLIIERPAYIWGGFIQDAHCNKITYFYKCKHYCCIFHQLPLHLHGILQQPLPPSDHVSTCRHTQMQMHQTLELALHHGSKHYSLVLARPLLLLQLHVIQTMKYGLK